MSGEFNPNIYTPDSISTAIWCSFWAIWTRLPTWFQFCSSHVGQSCLVLLGNLFIYPPAQPSLTSDGSHGAHEYIQEALCGHERCLLRWHCSTVWVWLVLSVPSNHSFFYRVRGWVLSQWFQHTDRSLFFFATQAPHSSTACCGQSRGRANCTGKSYVSCVALWKVEQNKHMWYILCKCICVLAFCMPQI